MRSRGLTLLELMICFTLVLLLVIFILNLFPGSLLALRQSELRLEAQRQAERILLVARNAAFDAYALDTPATLPACGLNGTRFNPVLEVHAVSGLDSAFVREMTVTVRWQEHSNDRSLKVSSRISRAF